MAVYSDARRHQVRIDGLAETGMSDQFERNKNAIVCP